MRGDVWRQDVAWVKRHQQRASDASLVLNADLIAMQHWCYIFYLDGCCINLAAFIIETACQIGIHFQQKAKWALLDRLYRLQVIDSCSYPKTFCFQGKCSPHFVLCTDIMTRDILCILSRTCLGLHCYYCVKTVFIKETLEGRMGQLLGDLLTEIGAILPF